MTVSASLVSADSAPPPDASAIPAFVFPSQSGTGSVFQFSPGQDVYASLGSSAGQEDVNWFLRTAKQGCVVGVCEGIAGSKSAVTHVGTGPTVTAALTGSLTGPLLSTSIGAKVTTGGANGVAQLGYYLDGSGDFTQYSAVIPAELPAVLIGVIDITNGAVFASYSATVLNNGAFTFDAPGGGVILGPGTGSLSAATAGLRAAFATSVAVQTWTSADLLAPGLAAILAHARKVTFLTGGVTPADAPATVTITGFRYGVAKSEVLSLSQVAGNVSSVNTYTEITSFVFSAGQGVAATVAAGYSSAFADAAEIVTALQEEADAGSLPVTFSIYETSTGQYLMATTDDLGSGITETISEDGDIDLALGFTTAAGNLTTTGAAATLVIPYVGITLTFASGTYVADDTYTMTTTGPGASVAAITAAETLIRNSGYAFGYILPLVVPSSAGNARTLCDAQDALVSTWDTNANQPIFPIQLTPGPFHTASATPATNAANITANDTALVAAFDGQVSIGTVVPDDGYRTGTKVLGRYRRPAALGVSYMMSRFLLSDDPGAATHGVIPEWSLTAPDGMTLARDQANPTTVIQLGGSTGPGFTVLQNVNGSPRVKRGVTRAGTTSRLVDLGPGLRMGRRGQAVLYNTAKTTVENENYPTDANGRIIEGVRKALEGSFETDLGAALLTPPLNLNASSVDVTIDDTEIIANTHNVTVTAVLQKLGSAENVTITAIVAGVVQGTTIQG